MSRLKKEKKRLKVATCGLALALAIGLAQGLGTYALFSDTEDVEGSLAISTGDVDVEVGEGKNFTDVKPGTGEVKTIPFTITNQGTLNQNLNLNLFISEDIESYLVSRVYLSNNIILKEDGFLYDNSGLLVLAPGESINGTIEITVEEMSREVQNSLSGKPYDVNLNVRSTQINEDNTLVDNGFFDVAMQKNTITIAQRDIITIATGEKAYFTNGNGNSFEKLYIPVNVKSTTANITISAIIESIGGGNHTTTTTYDAEHYYSDKYGDYILVKSTTNNDDLPFKGIVNITIKVTVKDGLSEDIYYLKCNVTLENAGNDCKDDHPDHGLPNKPGDKCHGEIVYDGHINIMTIPELEGEPIPEILSNQDVVELPKEEIEVPREPETVEPPKEEIEVPSEPEIVEPPKQEIEVPNEPEIVEPSKVEITKVPKQPEITEPPKTEISELQKETEAIQ